MEQTFASANIQKSKSAVKTILLAGLVAGMLDITAAITSFAVLSGGKPITLLQIVASGYFGKAAFDGGYTTALWGLLFHFFIAYTWAIVFFLVYPRIGILQKNKIITGLVYGIFVWMVMNLIVVPMSNFPNFAIHFPRAIIGIVILMVCIGLPISLIVSRYYSGK